jgi:hypothetical protein
LSPPPPLCLLPSPSVSSSPSLYSSPSVSSSVSVSGLVLSGAGRPRQVHASFGVLEDEISKALEEDEELLAVLDSPTLLEVPAARRDRNRNGYPFATCRFATLLGGVK